MLEMMWNKGLPDILRLDAASRAAPYIHPRLATVNIERTEKVEGRANTLLETAKAVAYLMRLAEQGMLGPLEQDGEDDTT